MATTKGFIKLGEDRLLPITRAELVLDERGNVALTSELFAAGGKNAYGLISAAERALLQTESGNSGMSISDIYDKLSYINTGLLVNNTPVNFYNATNGSALTTNIISNPDFGINVSYAQNTILFGLQEIHNTESKIENSFINNVTVDKFGRITAISGKELSYDDLPETISNKILASCTTSTEEIGNDSKAIANKKYVDDKVQNVTGLATGGLKFKGGISSWETASGYLTADYLNSYFKVTGTFSIDTSYLYEPSNTSKEKTDVKAGDTLIVYQGSYSSPKFVFIPSADDDMYITLSDSDGNQKVINHLRFSKVFSVTSTSNSATVTLPQVTTGTDGYLSAKDYAEFKDYKTSLNVSYSSRFTSGSGVYEIGTLTVGTKDSILYGKDTTYTLTVQNGSTSGANLEYNPILRLSDCSSNNTDIVFKGGKGIRVKKDGSAIEISALYTVADNSKDYLSLDDNNQLEVKLGKVNSNGSITNGLVSFDALSNFADQVHRAFVRFESIDYSLSGNDSETYQYGTKLAQAVNVTI